MERSKKEEYCTLTAKLMVYLKGKKATREEKSDANEYYGRRDYTVELCSIINSMSEEEINKKVYDGRNPEARKLADWWDNHKKEDAQRMKKK